MNYEVWAMKFELEVWTRSLNCEVWTVKSELWTVKYEVWTMKSELWSLINEVWSVNYAVWSVNCELRSVNYELWTVNYEVGSLKYEVWSLKREVWTVNWSDRVAERLALPTSDRGSRVRIPLDASFGPNLNGASLHRAFYVHPSIVLIWLKYSTVELDLKPQIIHPWIVNFEMALSVVFYT